MRTRLEAAPAYLRFLVNALLSGLIFGLIQRFQEHESWAASLLWGLVFGLYLALVTSLTSRRRRREIDAMTAGLTPTQRVEATRTALRAPVPTDPRVRDVAVYYAEYLLGEMNRQRARSTWMFAIVDAICVVLAITTAPFWWLAVIAMSWLLMQQLIEPRRLRRRLDLLRASAAGRAAIV